ncbi:Catechol 2,3-dioxygenase [Actinokineospora alba]|uniref:Catechol 2,3-dioxygenase n=1 Tax=Actinokineospora alba TaxID=504798 RepID=A0A1H0I2P1_9PSEU|nr:VOC family protein [Actinokineospora alba]TDP64631.1 catechol 2,3-dioxygenase-like lactoylglutathione lyase family enzyme [Actinokineospora alba]SDI85561.1 Catechol 2,3-dioxygenase [Actinokineospora alba]SDO25737.1 Catechol 2,3-dioxygenase [Actinokineospora alba]
MPIQLNHTIVAARDKAASAQFMSEILGLPKPFAFGPFLCVQTDNDVTLDFIDSAEVIATQHYAFLVSEDEFDVIFDRIKDRNLTYWADPHHRQIGEINTNDGGRGVYFDDPDGHALEILTRPYGSGS